MKNNRRDFLKSAFFGGGMLATSPLQLFLTNMMVNMLQVASARAAGLEEAFGDNKFVHFSMAGGATRWYFDLPLRPNGNDTLDPNGMIISKFKMGGTLSGEYANVKVGDYYLPYLWSSQIPTPGGSTAMSVLAQNMLTIRGVDLQLDSHELDRIKQNLPVPGASLTGLTADKSKAPISALSTGGDLGFSSHKGLANVAVSGGNPLSQALAPFSNGASIKEISNADIDRAIDQALLSLQASSPGKSAFVPTSFQDRANAKALLKKNFGNLQDIYNTLLAKYRLLVSRSMGERGLFLRELDDTAIGGDSNSNLFNINGIRYTGNDITTLTDSSSSIGNLAEGMAISEFMLTQGLTSSINVVTGGINNVFIDSGLNIDNNNAQVTNQRFGYGLDQHEVGAYTSLVVMSRFYRGWAACLNELIVKLKSTPASGGTMFDKTVIALSSEFNRSARRAGNGSDHGWEGSNYTVFSGMVPSLTVLGNVTQLPQNNGYGGTWGLAGSVEEIGGRRTVIGNVASTICTMLEVQSPTPNDASYVSKQNGKITPSIGKAKNVAS